MPKESMVLSVRLPRATGERLKRLARRAGRTPSDATARLVEEGLRRADFAFIDFRDSALGRQAFIMGSRLPVWLAAKLAETAEGGAAGLARRLCRPAAHIRAALNYAAAFPDEIAAAIEESASFDLEKLSRLLPHVETFLVRE
ncbi:MAG TPA: transcriptional regulator [Planctomycetes bacterium]|nr:transcriptional regulator [Planctomycetota bacterium]